MRILIAGYELPDSFSENVAFTLRKMGHEVVSPPPPVAGRVVARVRALYAEVRASLGGYVPPHERWLIRECRRRPADLVLAITREVSAPTLAELRRLGAGRLVAWWGDAPANMKGPGLLVPGWDLVCLKDPDAVEDFRRVGINAALLHEACNPEWHKPIAHCANDEVVVAGNYYGMRQALIRALMTRGVKLALYGPPLPRWSFPELRPLHRGRYIVKDAKSKVFGRGLACLNSTSLAEGNSLNCRAFEIAGTGGLQLIEDRPIVRECFEPGREVLTYSTVDEIVEHLEHAKADPAWARGIRAAGAKRAHGEHTYRHRLEWLLNEVR